MTRDYFGQEADLSGKKLWLLDMDGTIYMEDRVYEGTRPFLTKIRESGGRYVFITNNSSKSVSDYVEKLSRMGIAADEEAFFTSAQATIRLLQARYPGAKVYCQGTKSLIRELTSAGIRITEQVEPVDVVLLGFDLEMTSEKLRRTCQILTEQKNVAYYATNPDLVCPVSFGYVPDCGSISVMLRNATGREPTFIGKPEPTMLQFAMEKYNCGCAQTVVVGDRLYTDIASGLNAGVTSICVLSGEATVEDIQNGPIRPTLTFRDVSEICAAFSSENGAL